MLGQTEEGIRRVSMHLMTEVFVYYCMLYWLREFSVLKVILRLSINRVI